MKRLLTLLMMAMLVLVNGTALAAAMCVHENPAGHAAALHAPNAGEAAVAHAEDAAGAAVAKRVTLADAGSLMLAAMVVVPSSEFLRPRPRAARPPMQPDDPSLLGTTILPLLEPPAA